MFALCRSNSPQTFITTAQIKAKKAIPAVLYWPHWCSRVEGVAANEE